MPRRYPPGFAGATDRPIRKPTPPADDATPQARRPWQAYINYVQECDDNDEIPVSFSDYCAKVFMAGE